MARIPRNIENRNPEPRSVVQYPTRDPGFDVFARAIGLDDVTADPHDAIDKLRRVCRFVMPRSGIGARS